MDQIDFPKSPSGADLSVRHKLPAGTPKAIVQINHGMAEHSVRYARFANALAEADFATYAHDHRGHGHTKAAGSALGIFARQGSWQAVLDDVQHLNRTIAGIHPDVPIICFGHSMGAIIGFNYILRHPESIQGAALWNAGVETGVLSAVFKLILKTQRMFKGSDVPSGLAKKLTFDAWNKDLAPNRTDFDWLSHDEAEVDKYVNDPLCGFEVSIGLWLDVLEGVYFAANDKNLTRLPKDLPIHLQAGDQDPCSEKGKAVAHIETRMKAIGLSDVTFELLKNTRHESLNEVNRDETTATFIEWLDERFG